MHDCTTGFIDVWKATHKLVTDPNRGESDWGWKSTVILVPIYYIHFTDDRWGKTKVGNDAVHDLKGGVTKDTLLTGIDDDTGATTALCPFCLVG